MAFTRIAANVNEKRTIFKPAQKREIVIWSQMNLCLPDFTQNQRWQMTQAQHYRFQADQAKRLASQVTDSEVRARLLEMAGEYSRYAELVEARETQVF
jgi:hypothetical protein